MHVGHCSALLASSHIRWFSCFLLLCHGLCSVCRCRFQVSVKEGWARLFPVWRVMWTAMCWLATRLCTAFASAWPCSSCSSLCSWSKLRAARTPEQHCTMGESESIQRRTSRLGPGLLPHRCCFCSSTATASNLTEWGLICKEDHMIVTEEEKNRRASWSLDGASLSCAVQLLHGWYHGTDCGKRSCCLIEKLTFLIFQTDCVGKCSE